MERYYTAAQIGEMLGGKSARTVRQMIARGDFGDTLQDGKQHLVPASGLEAYIRARTGPNRIRGILQALGPLGKFRSRSH